MRDYESEMTGMGDSEAISLMNFIHPKIAEMATICRKIWKIVSFSAGLLRDNLEDCPTRELDADARGRTQILKII
jgi:hypothetical protein